MSTSPVAQFPTKEHLEETAAFIRSKAPGFSAVIGIQLGTGSNELGDQLDESPKPVVIPYSEIPHFTAPTVHGHSGEFICGYFSGIPVFCLKGRVHFYEGLPLTKTTYPIRVLAQLGVKALILTNAAGCMRLEWKLGDLMLVSDHINFFGTNPLIGPNLDLFPPYSTRFPDISNCYDKELRGIMRETAKTVGLEGVLREGVYLAYSGPSFETPAEAQFFKKIGADTVGMSTIPEVIVAAHSGIRSVAFSVVTDICEADAHPDHFEIMRVGHESSDRLIRLLRSALPAVLKVAEEQIAREKQLAVSA